MPIVVNEGRLRTKASHEGYLLIDHRESPGLGPKGTPRGRSTRFEAPISICKHCQRGIVRNPWRLRSRAYCPGCDHYICDDCNVLRVASGGVCRTFEQTIQDVISAALEKEQRGRSGIFIPTFTAPAQPLLLPPSGL